MFQATQTDHNLCWNDRTPATTVVGKHYFLLLGFFACKLEWWWVGAHVVGGLLS